MSARIIERNHSTAPGHPGRSFILIAAIIILLSGCSAAALSPPSPVSVADILQMSQEGVPPKTIIDRIRASGTVYRLSASELADLRLKGVVNQVIDYMQNTYLEAVRKNQQLQDENFWHLYDDGYYYGGYPFGWPDGWYPIFPYDEPYAAPIERPMEQPMESSPSEASSDLSAGGDSQDQGD